MGPVPYQILPKAIPGKWYVCEQQLVKFTRSPITVPVAYRERRLRGPYDTETEAIHASGALEAEYLYYKARTEVWQCPIPEPDNIAPIMTGFGVAECQPLPRS